jgi:ADP-heptose:LPS heptosyltransferase
LLFCNTTNGIYLFYDQLAAVFGTSPVAGGECEREFRSRLGDHEFASVNSIRLAIAPACSGLSRERMLRHEEWVEIVAARIALLYPAAAVELHLLGAPSDRDDLAQMAALLAARFNSRATVFNHAGETNLRESVRIVAAMDEVLCIDSALLHFSRLLGRPTVSYWGPTDPRTLIRPNARNLDEIHYIKISCSPCVHVSNQPPCRGQNICMRLAFDPAAALPRNQPWVLME